VQPLVIFPRVHVARNVGRFNRNPFDPIAMRREQRAQTALVVEGQQFVPVSEINQDGMSTASCVLGLDEPGSASPFRGNHPDGFSRNGRMVDQRND
jgi:hypothetical protein